MEAGQFRVVKADSESNSVQRIKSFITNSYLDKTFAEKSHFWEIESVHIVHNELLEHQYSLKKIEMESVGQVRENVFFTCYRSNQHLKRILLEGLSAQSSRYNFLGHAVKFEGHAVLIALFGLCCDHVLIALWQLKIVALNATGDSEKGIVLCQHADIQLNAATMNKHSDPNVKCWLVLFLTASNKAIAVTPSNDPISKLAPSADADCHMSSEMACLTDTIQDQAIRSQIYVFDRDCSRPSGYAARPRQCRPIAYVVYKKKQQNSQSIIRAVHLICSAQPQRPSADPRAVIDLTESNLAESDSAKSSSSISNLAGAVGDPTQDKQLSDRFMSLTRGSLRVKRSSVQSKSSPYTAGPGPTIALGSSALSNSMQSDEGVPPPLSTMMGHFTLNGKSANYSVRTMPTIRVRSIAPHTLASADGSPHLTTVQSGDASTMHGRFRLNTIINTNAGGHQSVGLAVRSQLPSTTPVVTSQFQTVPLRTEAPLPVRITTSDASPGLWQLLNSSTVPRVPLAGPNSQFISDQSGTTFHWSQHHRNPTTPLSSLGYVTRHSSQPVSAGNAQFPAYPLQSARPVPVVPAATRQARNPGQPQQLPMHYRAQTLNSQGIPATQHNRHPLWYTNRTITNSSQPAAVPIHFLPPAYANNCFTEPRTFPVTLPSSPAQPPFQPSYGQSGEIQSNSSRAMGSSSVSTSASSAVVGGAMDTGGDTGSTVPSRSIKNEFQVPRRNREVVFIDVEEPDAPLEGDLTAESSAAEQESNAEQDIMSWMIHDESLAGLVSCFTNRVSGTASESHPENGSEQSVQSLNSIIDGIALSELLQDVVTDEGSQARHPSTTAGDAHNRNAFSDGNDTVGHVLGPADYVAVAQPMDSCTVDTHTVHSEYNSTRPAAKSHENSSNMTSVTAIRTFSANAGANAGLFSMPIVVQTPPISIGSGGGHAFVQMTSPPIVSGATSLAIPSTPTTIYASQVIPLYTMPLTVVTQSASIANTMPITVVTQSASITALAAALVSGVKNSAALKKSALAANVIVENRRKAQQLNSKDAVENIGSKPSRPLPDQAFIPLGRESIKMPTSKRQSVSKNVKKVSTVNSIKRDCETVVYKLKEGGHVELRMVRSPLIQYRSNKPCRSEKHPGSKLQVILELDCEADKSCSVDLIESLAKLFGFLKVIDVPSDSYKLYEFYNGKAVECVASSDDPSSPPSASKKVSKRPSNNELNARLSNEPTVNAWSTVGMEFSDMEPSDGEENVATASSSDLSKLDDVNNDIDLVISNVCTIAPESFEISDDDNPEAVESSISKIARADEVPVRDVAEILSSTGVTVVDPPIGERVAGGVLDSSFCSDSTFSCSGSPPFYVSIQTNFFPPGSNDAENNKDRLCMKKVVDHQYQLNTDVEFPSSLPLEPNTLVMEDKLSATVTTSVHSEQATGSQPSVVVVDLSAVNSSSSESDVNKVALQAEQSTSRVDDGDASCESETELQRPSVLPAADGFQLAHVARAADAMTKTMDPLDTALVSSEAVLLPVSDQPSRSPQSELVSRAGDDCTTGDRPNENEEISDDDEWFVDVSDHSCSPVNSVDNAVSVFCEPELMNESECSDRQKTQQTGSFSVVSVTNEGGDCITDFDKQNCARAEIDIQNTNRDGHFGESIGSSSEVLCDRLVTINEVTVLPDVIDGVICEVVQNKDKDIAAVTTSSGVTLCTANSHQEVLVNSSGAEVTQRDLECSARPVDDSGLCHSGLSGALLENDVLDNNRVNQTEDGVAISTSNVDAETATSLQSIDNSRSGNESLSTSQLSSSSQIYLQTLEMEPISPVYLQTLDMEPISPVMSYHESNAHGAADSRTCCSLQPLQLTSNGSSLEKVQDGVEEKISKTDAISTGSNAEEHHIEADEEIRVDLDEIVVISDDDDEPSDSTTDKNECMTHDVLVVMISDDEDGKHIGHNSNVTSCDGAKANVIVDTPAVSKDHSLSVQGLTSIESTLCAVNVAAELSDREIVESGSEELHLVILPISPTWMDVADSEMELFTRSKPASKNVSVGTAKKIRSVAPKLAVLSQHQHQSVAGARQKDVSSKNDSTVSSGHTAADHQKQKSSSSSLTGEQPIAINASASLHTSSQVGNSTAQLVPPEFSSMKRPKRLTLADYKNRKSTSDARCVDVDICTPTVTQSTTSVDMTTVDMEIDSDVSSSPNSKIQLPEKEDCCAKSISQDDGVTEVVDIVHRVDADGSSMASSNKSIINLTSACTGDGGVQIVVSGSSVKLKPNIINIDTGYSVQTEPNINLETGSSVGTRPNISNIDAGSRVQTEPHIINLHLTSDHSTATESSNPLTAEESSTLKPSTGTAAESLYDNERCSELPVPGININDMAEEVDYESTCENSSTGSSANRASDSKKTNKRMESSSVVLSEFHAEPCHTLSPKDLVKNNPSVVGRQPSLEDRVDDLSTRSANDGGPPCRPSGADRFSGVGESCPARDQVGNESTTTSLQKGLFEAIVSIEVAEQSVENETENKGHITNIQLNSATTGVKKSLESTCETGDVGVTEANSQLACSLQSQVLVLPNNQPLVVEIVEEMSSDHLPLFHRNAIEPVKEVNRTEDKEASLGQEMIVLSSDGEEVANVYDINSALFSEFTWNIQESMANSCTENFNTDLSDGEIVEDEDSCLAAKVVSPTKDSRFISLKGKTHRNNGVVEEAAKKQQRIQRFGSSPEMIKHSGPVSADKSVNQDIGTFNLKPDSAVVEAVGDISEMMNREVESIQRSVVPEVGPLQSIAITGNLKLSSVKVSLIPSSESSQAALGKTYSSKSAVDISVSANEASGQIKQSRAGSAEKKVASTSAQSRASRRTCNSSAADAWEDIARSSSCLNISKDKDECEPMFDHKEKLCEDYVCQMMDYFFKLPKVSRDKHISCGRTSLESTKNQAKKELIYSSPTEGLNMFEFHGLEKSRPLAAKQLKLEIKLGEINGTLRRVNSIRFQQLNLNTELRFFTECNVSMEIDQYCSLLILTTHVIHDALYKLGNYEKSHQVFVLPEDLRLEAEIGRYTSVEGTLLFLASRTLRRNNCFELYCLKVEIEEVQRQISKKTLPKNDLIGQLGWLHRLRKIELEKVACRTVEHLKFIGDSIALECAWYRRLSNFMQHANVSRQDDFRSFISSHLQLLGKHLSATERLRQNEAGVWRLHE